MSGTSLCMGNQGKIAKKPQSGVSIHVSVVSFIFEKIIFTVNSESSFLHLVAFLIRLSQALASVL